MSAKILVVDDEPHILDAVKETLSHDYEVVTASNGEEALSQIKANVLDAIILDVMMPEPDGFEVCSIIKGNVQYKDIPVIFLTAKGQLDEIEAGMKLGAHSYIVKPFSPKLLVEKVQKVLEKPVVQSTEQETENTPA